MATGAVTTWTIVFTPYTALTDTDTIKAVSYTHLDVYKRQASPFAIDHAAIGRTGSVTSLAFLGPDEIV